MTDPTDQPLGKPQPLPAETEESLISGVQKYLLYSLSIPERTLRVTVGLTGGVLRESTELLVPQAFRDSKTYTILVRQSLDFLVEDVGKVTRDNDAGGPPKVENFVARKTVGNFIELAGLATLHMSPLTLLAVVADVAYGSKAYLKELAVELEQQGVIDQSSSIHNVDDLLEAVATASGTAATTFDTPPLSVDGLRETINQTREAVSKIDPTHVIPKAELDKLWGEMKETATREHVSLFDVASTVTLYSLGKIATVGKGALSTVKVAGILFDRHVIDHYEEAIVEIHKRGLYATLSETAAPYIDSVWTNFSTDSESLTEDVFTGRLIGRAWGAVRDWWSKEPDPRAIADAQQKAATAGEQPEPPHAATNGDPPSGG